MISRAGHLEKRESDNIEWRRDKVRELYSKLLSVREIAEVLKIPKSTIHSDIVYLRAQAKENIKSYVDQTLVQEFDRINIGLEQVIRNCWTRYEAAAQEKERYAFLSLLKDTYALRASILDSGTILQRAVGFIHQNNNTKDLTAGGQNTKVTIDIHEESVGTGRTNNSNSKENVSTKPKQSNS